MVGALDGKAFRADALISTVRGYLCAPGDSAVRVGVTPEKERPESPPAWLPP